MVFFRRETDGGFGDLRYVRFENDINATAVHGFDIFGLRPREGVAAITERDLRTRCLQGGRRFERRITTADHKHLSIRKLGRIVQAIGDLIQILSRHSQLSVVTAATDRHDHPTRLEGCSIRVVELDEISLAD